MKYSSSFLLLHLLLLLHLTLNLLGFSLHQPRHSNPSYSAPFISSYLFSSLSKSLHISSNHLILGLQVHRHANGFHSDIIFIILYESVLCMWPRNLIQHEALTTNFLSAVSDFTQQLSHIYEHHAEEMQVLVSNFRKRNAELRKER